MLHAFIHSTSSKLTAVLANHRSLSRRGAKKVDSLYLTWDIQDVYEQAVEKELRISHLEKGDIEREGISFRSKWFWKARVSTGADGRARHKCAALSHIN